MPYFAHCMSYEGHALQHGGFMSIKYLYITAAILASVMTAQAKVDDAKIALRHKFQKYLQAKDGVHAAQLYTLYFESDPDIVVHTALQHLNNDVVFETMMSYFDHPDRCFAFVNLNRVIFVKPSYNTAISKYIAKHKLEKLVQAIAREDAQLPSARRSAPVMPAPSAPALEPLVPSVPSKLEHEVAKAQYEPLPGAMYPIAPVYEGARRVAVEAMPDKIPAEAAPASWFTGKKVAGGLVACAAAAAIWFARNQ
jgi:hypothetical protein